MEIPRYYPRGGYIDQDQICPKYIKWGLCVDCDFRINHSRCPFVQQEWELKQKVTPAFLTDKIECLNCKYQLTPHDFLLQLNNLRGYKEIGVKIDKVHHIVFIDNCSYCKPVDGWYVGTPNHEIIENADSPLAIEQAKVVNRLLNKNAQVERDDFEVKEKLYRSKWVQTSDFNYVDQGAIAKSNSYLEFDVVTPEPIKVEKMEEDEDFDPLAENIPLGMSPCANHKQRAAYEVCEFCYKSFCRQCIIHFADKCICSNCIDRKETKQLLVRLGYMTDEYDHKYTESHYTPDSYDNPLMVKRNGDYALPFRKIIATIIDFFVHRFFLIGFMFIFWVILSKLLSFGHISSYLVFIDDIFKMPYEELMVWPFGEWKYYPISAFTLSSEAILVLFALMKYRQTLGMHIAGVIYGNDVGNHNTFSTLVLTSIFHELNILSCGLLSVTAIWDRHYRSVPEYILGTRTLTVWQSLFTENPLETVYLTGKREPPLFVKRTNFNNIVDTTRAQEPSIPTKSKLNQYFPETFDSENPVTPRE